MLPFKRTFDSEKQQLQQLNSRLGQYLSRTKQLEQENAHLLAEINQLRVARSVDNESKYKAEMHDLRRMVDQLSLEKSQAEMEREKLWRELQMVQSLCSEQTEVCRDISGDLKGCEKELQQAHKINGQLQQRLAQLHNQYQCLEDAHRKDKAHLLQQVESRVAPIITQTYRGPPVVSANEVQQYARGLSDGWIHTFEMYQQKVEEMEESIRADQARLSDLQREKMLYASELGKMRTEAEKQGQIQMRLEEQLVNMQERFRADFGEYQMIIDELEHERNVMADTIAEKMREHQHLLQVKMDLGMEVAAYRALLEGGRVGLPDTHRRVNQQQRERIIDIKLPAQPYSPRTSTLTTRQQTNVRYSPPASSLRTSHMSSSGSISPSRVIPISIAERARNQSPASRRDMISFNKARAAASASSTTTTTTTTTKDKLTGYGEKQKSPNIQKTTTEEKTVKIKQVSEVDSPIKSSVAETKSVRVMSTPMTSFSAKTETEGKTQVSDEKEKGKRNTESILDPTEKKILDSVSVEEIIEKVMKPAGLEGRACSSGDSKVRYHVEKTEQEDGTTKTQIVLESKVEEELDISEDSALEELLSQGVKKVSLEDIKGTATGSMIQNLLSGLQGGESLQNKSVNVEIIEEPVESHSDEELEVKQKSGSTFYEPSTYFQIEELDNVTADTRFERGSDDDAFKSHTPDTDQFKSGSVQGQEFSRKSEPSHFYQDQESHEYFVSTPDDNFSEPEESGGITSYGHYGIVDDLSDERYYQDEAIPQKRVIVEESDDYKFTSGDRVFAKEGFPECIIEEEVRVSPIVQESVLEFLREDSLEPKEQLKGALEKLQSSVSGPLREELAFLTQVSDENPQKVAVDIKKVQQSSGNGTTTIVAELNVSQSLEDSGLLGAGDDLSEEQIMTALRSSNLGLEDAFKGGAGEGYTIRVSKEEVVHGGGFEGFADEGASQPELKSQIVETPVRISHEKRVATVYLDSPSED
ncbi:unnamed protein product [Ophioblennius macclurei]